MFRFLFGLKHSFFFINIEKGEGLFEFQPKPCPVNSLVITGARGGWLKHGSLLERERITSLINDLGVHLSLSSPKLGLLTNP